MRSVALELLQELADRLPENPTTGSRRGTSIPFNLEQWINDRRLGVTETTPWNGSRRWVFATCPWNPDHRNRSAFIIQFPTGAIAAGCLHNGCRGKDWHALKDLMEPGWRSNDQHFDNSPSRPERGTWKVPLPFSQFDLPRFPTEALPDRLRAFVEAEAIATQTPVDLTAMLTLSVIGASCAKKVVVCMKEGYFEPVNIFTVTALPSGTRKTSVFAAVTKPMEDWERSESRRGARENAKRRSQLKVKELEHKKLQEQAAEAKGKEKERLNHDAEVLAAELADTGASHPTRLIADDCTPEKLQTLLRDNGGRIAVLSAEGDVFELLAGRYSANKTPNFGVYLKGHAGDPLRIDRIVRTEFVNHPALTVGLTVQPDVIRGLAEKRGFRERGLLGRFLYSFPENLLGRRETDPTPVPFDVREAYRANVRALLAIPLRNGEDGETSARMLMLAADARAAIHRFDQWVEPRLGEFGELGSITDWAGKLVGSVGRIAGILHMASQADSSAPWEIPISHDTVERAIRIGRYLIPHAKAAFAEMGADPVVENAKRVLRWIEHRKLSSFTCRELHQAMRGTFNRVAELAAPLAVLVDHEFIRLREQIASGSPGRPPSPMASSI